MDAYIKKSTDLSKSALHFVKTFLKQPVTTIQAKSITLPQAILFAALLPISMFILLRVTIGRMFSGIPRQQAALLAPTASEYLGIFMRLLLSTAIVIVAGVVLVIVFGKIFYKVTVDVKMLFSLTVVTYIPIIMALLVSAIFAFISIHLVMFALILGCCAYFFLYPSAIKVALNTDSDKAAYLATFASTAVMAISWLYVWNMIGSELMGIFL